MALSDFKTAILLEADITASAIAAESEAVSNKEKNRIQKKAMNLEEEIITNAEKQAVNAAAAIHQSARQEARAAVLNAKQSELDKTQQLAVKYLLDQESDKTEELMKKLFSKLQKDKDSQIIPGSKQEDLVTKLAKKAGFDVAKKTIKDSGGFVHQAQYTSTNFLYHHLVKQVFNQHRAEIARTLFE